MNRKRAADKLAAALTSAALWVDSRVVRGLYRLAVRVDYRYNGRPD